MAERIGTESLKTYSVKLPRGMPERLRQRFDVPFSQLVRTVLENLEPKEKNDDASSSDPTGVPDYTPASARV